MQATRAPSRPYAITKRNFENEMERNGIYRKIGERQKSAIGFDHCDRSTAQALARYRAN